MKIEYKYKYSIIIPVYNCSKYLKRCINSIINQKSNYEIILVDDGSTDNSGKMCDEYSKKYNNIKAFHQENRGVSVARNHGISKAEGNYILFVDGDDYVSNNYFSVIEKNLKESNYMLCFNLAYDNGTKKFFKKVNIPKGNKNKKKYFLKNNKLFNSPVNKIYSSKIIKENKILFKEDIKSGEDYIFNVDYCNFIDDIFYVDIPLYYYYNNPMSITHNKSGMTIEQQMKMFDYEYMLSSKEDDELKYLANNYIIGLYSVIKFNILNKYSKEYSIQEIKKIYK